MSMGLSNISATQVVNNLSENLNSIIKILGEEKNHHELLEILLNSEMFKKLQKLINW